MSRDREIRRIPTSAELEARGQVGSPQPGHEGQKKGLLKRLFRASRFRVADNVAAAKHIGASRMADIWGDPDVPPATAPKFEGTDAPTLSPQSAPPPRPRTIRIPDSVRERRGLRGAPPE